MTEGNLDADLELVKADWINQQIQLCSEIVEEDSPQLKAEVGLFGGLDISFIIGDSVNACACYAIINRDLEVVYKDLKMVQMTAPYIPGFLGFREAGALSQMVDLQVREKPELTPGVLMVDGNGILHPRLCGVACHVGLATKIPTLGVAKNLHLIDQLADGFSRDEIKAKFSMMDTTGQHIILKNRAGRWLGAALKTSCGSKNPVYVSIGSGISLLTAISLVTSMSRHRIPEPIRQADQLSREYLRMWHPTARQLQNSRQPGKTKKPETF